MHGRRPRRVPPRVRRGCGSGNGDQVRWSHVLPEVEYVSCASAQVRQGLPV